MTDIAAIKDELRALLAAAPDGPPWIRRWQSLDVHGMRGDGVFTEQRNIDLAVAAVNALDALLADTPSVEPPMTGRFDGPDCGVDGCAREVGHIGDHRRDPEVANLSTSDLPRHGVIEYDDHDEWLTESDAEGAARIVARDVPRWFGRLVEAALRPSVEPLQAALWECYVQSGADTDGDSGPGALIAGMGEAGFARAVVESVKQLRTDYNEVLDTWRAPDDAGLRPSVEPAGRQCSFMRGLDGYTNCTTHGWTGYRDDVRRVAVCPALLPTQASDSPEKTTYVKAP